MATDKHRIVLRGMGHYEEGEADATIYPGEAVRMAADGLYDPETLATTIAAGRGLTLAIENGVISETTDDAYADGDKLFMYIPLPGDHVQVLVKAGEDIDVGDYLAVEGSGSGKFVEVSSSATAEYPFELTSARKHDDMASLLPNAIANTVTGYKVPLIDGRLAADFANLLPNAQDDDYVFASGVHTWDEAAAAADEIVVTGATAGDVAVCSIEVRGTNNPTTVISALAGTDKITVTLDQNGENGVTKIDWVLLKAQSGSLALKGTPGTDGPTLQATDFGGTSVAEKAVFVATLPDNYVDGQAITLRARAAMLTTVADTSCTLDAEVWKDAGDGAIGSDICATAAQSMNSLTPANLDFIITPTGVVAGDRLIIRLSVAGTDSGDAGVMTPEITDIALRVVTATLADDMALVTGTPGTDVPTLQGVDFGGGTSDEKCAFEFILPQEYRAGSAVTIRLRAAMLTTVADASCTVDIECWKDAGDGAAGSDICATAAQDMNSLTAANLDFTITPTGLTPGDKLIIRISMAGTDSGDAGVMVPEISGVSALIGNAVAGQLEAYEDSGGALASATLIKCRVLTV